MSRMDMDLSVDPSDHPSVFPEWRLVERFTAMRLCVGIATRDRTQILERTMDRLLVQTRLPDEVILCSPAALDLTAARYRSAPFPIRHVVSELGLTKQRNTIMRSMERSDVLLFIDDDFFLGRTYIAEMIEAFGDTSIVVATGTVVADGIKGPGLSPEAAEQIIARDDAHPRPRGMKEVRHGYGCNMALRYRTLVEHGLDFDENLPRYGWYEDVDLMRRLARHGRAVQCTSARGVHLGTKLGRSSGKFLGYSQIANPIYLHKKGTYDRREAVVSIVQNFAANLVRSARPEAYIDRRGRLIGNLIGLRDLATRRLHPLKALQLDAPRPA
ncbi:MULTISPECIES: glycosyltransferase family 2 protein [Methylobacterium]|uniref:Glycosyltransferase n=1 Tax=Methylobacterium longum TaxID=767694 RepID=A0ABT8AIN1_9HYPH|nr:MULTISPECIES: glycosyltransferase [Methylobacterium]MCJ2099448.1 glycosyltransferase [Methylobacterium sp. E-046]MDN3569646.1 glycosyltransferase [Methylobacterium longum]